MSEILDTAFFLGVASGISFTLFVIFLFNPHIEERFWGWLRFKLGFSKQIENTSQEETKERVK